MDPPPTAGTSSNNAKRSSSPSGSASKKQKNGSSLPVSTPGSPTSAVRIVSSVTPIKAPRDPNEYRVITLSTGLRIVLISRNTPPNYGPSSSTNFRHSPANYTWNVNHCNPVCHFVEPVPGHLDCTADSGFRPSTVKGPSTILHRACPAQHNQTSVAAVVNVGGFNDPEQLQGLSHFMEHMVHYGTKKFPQEDAVNVVVANFGVYNATTSQHFTEYFNEVPDVLLDRNLELFAAMLAQPLFSINTLTREVNAVDNEFYLRLPSWRKRLLQSHVCIKTKQHPVTKFLCGNVQTLGGGTDGAQVQKAMQQHHKNNYVASAMTLSINSTKSLDELQELALAHFSNLLQGDRSIFAKTPDDKSQKLEFHENQHIFLQGGSSMAELSLIWYIPALSSFSHKEPVLPLIIRMLFDTSEKGLDHLLRSQGLIWSIYPHYQATRYTTMVEINFSLTKEGSQNTKKIVAATVEYLAYLQTEVSKTEMTRLFEEMRLLKLKDFHFGNQMTSLETTKDLAMRLQNIDNATDVLATESWSDSKFNFDSVKNTLRMLTDENVIVMETLPKGTAIETKGEVKIAPYSETKYVVTERKKKASTKGKKTVAGDGKVAGHSFSFVPPNRYLALDLKALVEHRNRNASGDASSYVLRCPDNFGEVKQQRLNWRSQQDPPHEEVIPKISGFHNGHCCNSYDPFTSVVQVKFVSPIVRNATATNKALSWLWAYSITQTISPIWSEIITAGYNISIEPGPGMIITVDGFPCHLERITKDLISQMFEKPVTLTVFSLAKQELTSVWEYLLSETDMVPSTLLRCSIFQQVDMSIDFLGSLADTTLDDLNMFIEGFKHSAFTVVELSGNLPVQTFQGVASHLEKMPYAPIADNNPSLYSPHFLPVDPDLYNSGETCIRVKNMESTAYTTSVTNVYVLGPYGKDQHQADCFAMAMHFMNCRAFMDLRTKQQLGYTVYVRKLTNQRVRVNLMMFSVTVTATAKKHSPCELDQKIDQFLAEYAQQLEQIPADIFNTMLRLTCTPATVNVANWFRERFDENFGKFDIKWKCSVAGIKKQTIQGNEEARSKICKCGICATIGEEDWKRGSNTESQFLFVVGKGATKDYFVSSPKY